ncbi:MAG: ExeA family protein [Pirellulales bacterium]
MYEAFYQLNGRPFVATALAGHYFRTASSEAARETTLRCVRRSEGAVLVVGGVGIGKSIFCSMIAQHLRPTHQVVTLAGGECVSRRALLQTILHRLGRPFRMEEGELRLALIDYISGYSLPATGLVLVIDEAQLLDIPLLEELRLLTNLVRYEQPCVHLVLAGNQEIEERFASPKLESFNQRLAARCYLAPFTQAETRGYLAARLAACNGQLERLFDDDAVRRIQQATDGVPRLVNQLCDHALVLGAAARRSPLDADAIAEAWADLQQFPSARGLASNPTLSPVSATAIRSAVDSGAANFGSGQGGATATIEFGTLDDEDESELVLASTPARSASNGHAHGATSAAAVATIELVDPVHAKHYQFEQEEVVVDRYARLESSGLGRRPRVESIEGRILGDLLQPFVQAETYDHIRIVAPPDAPDLAPQASYVAQPESGSCGDHDHGCCGHCHAAPANAWTDTIDEADDDTPDEVLAIDDSELIVIDEEAHDGGRHGIMRGAARRMEYEQLFAKLRRETQ